MPRLPIVLSLIGFACSSDGLGPIAPGEYAAVSGGFQNTCAITGEGGGVCWGDNAVGQGGNGVVGTIDSFPQFVHASFFFTSITAGDRQTCGIDTDDAAYCWGTSNEGALGSDTATITGVPIPVSGGLSFKEISAGWNYTCGLTTAGAAYCWGANSGDSHVPVPVAGDHVFTAISAGQYHTCAIAADGSAYCWGPVERGALGTGDSAGHATPALVAGGLHFTAISAGYTHTCAISTTGKAYCWGAGWFGDLGNGAMDDQYAPVAVSGIRTYRSITAGANHSCGLDTRGQLFCWGNNGANQLAGTATETCTIGPSTTVPCTSNPIASAGGHAFRSVGAGAFHTCAIRENGGAFCWGANNRGAIGNGATGASVATPFEVPEPLIPPPSDGR